MLGTRREGGVSLKIVVSLLMAACLAVAPGQASAVNCNRVHTALERTMCSNAELLELGREFGRLAADVSETGRGERATLEKLRNGFARRCRSSLQPAECLRRQHIAGIAKLRILLGPASQEPQIAAAKALPEFGQSARDEHGELAMLEVYRARLHSGTDAESRQAIKQLQQLIRTACSGGQRELRERLSWYGLSCGPR